MGQDSDHEMIRKGPWTENEDVQLVFYVNMFGDRRWDFIAKVSGLKRTGKSCRLRWVNYLHPGLKRGKMTPHEERLVLELHSKWGNRWSRIARKLPGRTDNEIKNYWRTHMRKKAQEKKRAASPSSSLSNSSSSSSICTSNPTVDSMPMSETKERSFYDTGGVEMGETKERSFYDTGGVEMAGVAKAKGSSNNMKSGAASVKDICDGQEGFYSMEEIWKDIDLLEDDGVKPVYDPYFDLAVPSPIWEYSFDTLWMMDGGQGEVEANVFFPTTSDQFSERLTG